LVSAVKTKGNKKKKGQRSLHCRVVGEHGGEGGGGEKKNKGTGTPAIPYPARQGGREASKEKKGANSALHHLAVYPVFDKEE